MSNRFVERISNQVVAASSSTASAVTLPPTELPTVDGVPVFTDQAATTLAPGTSRITYWVTYTPNAAVTATNQTILLVPWWGDGTSEYGDAGTDPGDFPGTGRYSTLTLYQTTFTINEIQPGETPLVLAIPMDVPAGVVTCRLLAKQLGNDDMTNTGTIAINITTAS